MLVHYTFGQPKLVLLLTPFHQFINSSAELVHYKTEIVTVLVLMKCAMKQNPTEWMAMQDVLRMFDVWDAGSFGREQRAYVCLH